MLQGAVLREGDTVVPCTATYHKGRSFSWPPTSHTVKTTFLYWTFSTLKPMVGTVVRTSPMCSLYRMVVLPAASNPSMTTRISLFPAAADCTSHVRLQRGERLASSIRLSDCSIIACRHLSGVVVGCEARRNPVKYTTEDVRSMLTEQGVEQPRDSLSHYDYCM